jgi:hypothetical protein
LEAGAHHGLASGFDDTGAGIPFEVVRLDPHRRGQLRIVWRERSQLGNQFPDIAVVEKVPVAITQRRFTFPSLG